MFVIKKLPDARLLSNRGYGIRKDCLTKDQQSELRKKLTKTPRTLPGFPEAESFEIFFQSETRYYVPRFWGIEHFGEPDGDVRTKGVDLPPDLKFNKTLRPNQIPIVEAFRAGGSNGLICVPCGVGKTFMAIHEAMRIGKRFLILVHQEFLADQWEQELIASVPGIRVGRVQGSLCQTGIIDAPKFTVAEIKSRIKTHDPERKVNNKKRDELLKILYEYEPRLEPKEGNEYDCTICLIQTIAGRSWPSDTFSRFGLTISDECHHLAAAYFCKALIYVQTYFMLGLSATPNRADGLEEIFKLFIGPIRYQIQVREPDTTVEVRVIRFESSDPAYSTVHYDFKGNPNRARLCNQIAEHKPRTKLLCDEMEVILREGRKLLVLSDRREHLAEFETDLGSRGFTSIGYYVGGMTPEARALSATKQIILATFMLASEGMNIKDLNTALLATPKSNIEQAVGRIFRLLPEERVFFPVIYEVDDASIGMLRGQLEKRKTFYRKCKYRILNRISLGVYKGMNGPSRGAPAVIESSSSEGESDGDGDGDDEDLSQPMFSSLTTAMSAMTVSPPASSTR